MTPERLEFSLPYPPSVNHYWRPVMRGGKRKPVHTRMLLTDQAIAFRQRAVIEIIQQRVPRRRLRGSLGVRIVIAPPDAQRRDLDNLAKPLLDVLTHSGVIEDDYNIDDLHLQRARQKPDGQIDITIWRLRYTAAFDLPVRPWMRFTPA